MSSIIHREAVVGPDGHIDIAAPELQPGQRVTITIEPEQTAQETEEKLPMHILMDEDEDEVEAPGRRGDISHQ